MNFFEQQDRARRQSKWLIVLFLVAVVAIVLAMNVVMLVAFGQLRSDEQGWLSPDFWAGHGDVALWTSVITVLVIVVASAYRSAQLRSGGGRVARELGGVEVTGDTHDPLRRRLLNVVEEMAIASGVPVPQVFVLEHEPGINAFAAGWTPSDAAVAVTRGALESLDREELQGVIAHEFSHVFNGDMRLNIRLIGVLFGILVLTVIGRRMLVSMHLTRGGRNRNAGAIALVAVAVVVIGYVGLFFGRWIQAAVSRQREYLADASAIQFTRSAEGLAGALKKIGARASGSTLKANADEVGHMLFALGLRGRLFSTHPPLEARIRKIDPSFQPGEFAELAREMERHQQSIRARREQERAEAEKKAALDLPGGISLDPAEMIHRIGEPGIGQALIAAALIQRVPAPLERAARSDQWVPELLLYLLLSADPETRETQLLMIAESQGAESEAQVRDLLNIQPKLPKALRLPLLELAFPALRRRPQDDLVELMRLADALIEADGRVDVFEYVLARLLNREIEEVLSPPRRPPGGRMGLAACGHAVSDLVGIVAMHGSPGDLEAARAAAGRAQAGLDELPSPDPERWREGWPARLDAIFRELRALRMDARRRLLECLLECARHDDEVIVAEYELLRLVGGMLQVPMPAAGGETG